MKKIGTKNRIFFFLLLVLSIFFIFRVSWTIHTQEKLVEKEISKHIDTIEQKLKYYLLNLQWKKNLNESSNSKVEKNDLIIFKKEKDEVYKSEIKNYYQTLKLLFESISTEHYTYSFIVSDDGRYLYHPNPSLLKETLFSEAKHDKDNDLYNKAVYLTQKKPNKYIGMLEGNKITSQKSRIEYRYFKDFNFYLGVVSVDEKSHFITISSIKKDLYLFFIALSSAFFIFITDKKNFDVKNIAFATIIQFCIFISFIATINYSSSKEEMKEFYPISSYRDLFGFLNKHNIFREGDIYIQIQDIDFLTNDNIKISGLIEYSKNNFERVFFPDSTDYSEAILKDKNGIVTKKFSFILAENFMYHKYPLESNIISIKMTTWNDNRYTVLTPNLTKYADKLLISSKWGLTKNININNWNILGSFFSYEEVENDNYNLTFNIYLKRNILAPFISNLLPFFVIIGLLFSLILLIPSKRDKLNIDFFLGSISGLFFTILLSQNSLRESITTGEILYLDYFYFFLYLILISIVTLIFLYKINLISYNIIKKLKLYFTYLILLILTIITFLNFPL